MEKSEYLKFADTCSNSYNSILLIADLLEKNGFVKLEENTQIDKSRSKCFIIFHEKSILAFDIKDITKQIIYLSYLKNSLFHIDKGSQMPSLNYNYCTIKSKSKINKIWSNRTMRVAGKITVKDDENLSNITVFPEISIGLTPSIEDNTTEFNMLLGLAADSVPIINGFPGPILQVVADSLDIDPYSIVDSDLYLVNSAKSCFTGENGQIISGNCLCNCIPIISNLNSFLDSNNSFFKIFMCIDENLDKDILANYLTKIFKEFHSSPEVIPHTFFVFPHHPINQTESDIFINPNDFKKISENSSIINDIGSQLNSTEEINPSDIIPILSRKITPIGIHIRDPFLPKEHISLQTIDSIEKIKNSLHFFF